MIKSKKGQITLDEAPSFIRVLVVIAITLALSALIMNGFRDSEITYTTTQVANETNTSRTLNSFNLATNVQYGLTGTAIVYNETNASMDIIPASNYSITASAGIATLTWLSPEYNDTKVNVTYNYLADPNDYFSNITESGLTGLQQFGDFQSLMALVIVAVIVLGLVLFIGSRR